jgi:hypothetical protein
MTTLPPPSLLPLLRVEAAGRTIVLNKVLLGVGGTVCKGTVGMLDDLGLQRETALTLLGMLSLYSANQQHRIVCIRRAKEREARKAKGIRSENAWRKRDPWAASKRRKAGVG